MTEEQIWAEISKDGLKGVYKMPITLHWIISINRSEMHFNAMQWDKFQASSKTKNFFSHLVQIWQFSESVNCGRVFVLFSEMITWNDAGSQKLLPLNMFLSKLSHKSLPWQNLTLNAVVIFFNEKLLLRFLYFIRLLFYSIYSGSFGVICRSSMSANI